MTSSTPFGVSRIWAGCDGGPFGGFLEATAQIAATTFGSFKGPLFEFLEQLADDNNRPWLPSTRSLATRYPDKLDSAHAGEELPVLQLPTDAPRQSGKENPYAGRADFYQLRYDPYLIAMHTTKHKTFELTPPPGVKQALDLVSKKTLSLEDAQVALGHARADVTEVYAEKNLEQAKLIAKKME